MVPITAELLRAHYATFRSPAVNSNLAHIRADMAVLRNALTHPTASSLGGHPPVQEVLAETVPPGLDSSMYVLRCACEEAAERLHPSSVTHPSMSTSSMSTDTVTLPDRLRAVAAHVDAFQKRQSAHVDKTVRSLLPNDFRSSLFAAARARSERANAAALEGLGLRDRYRVLWEQQWRRRELLTGIGSATGIWRWVVRYLGGVPEPLLTFAREINAPNGPTDALRVKFSGALKELVQFAIEMNALCAAAERPTSNASDVVTGTVSANVSVMERGEEVFGMLTRSLDLYEKEVDAFVELLEEVIVNSPFFVQPDELARYRDAAQAADHITANANA